MVSLRAIWQQAAHKPTNCLLAAQQELYKKPAEEVWEFSGKNKDGPLLH